MTYKLLLGVFAVFIGLCAQAEERSIVVEYVKVYDGDTVVVRLPSLPPPLDRLRIRLEGIDTPEIGKGARCTEEQVAAEAARVYLEGLMTGSSEIHVYSFRWDKYGGRILGDLHVTEGRVRDLAVKNGFAVPYAGTGPRHDWCPSTASPVAP